MKTKHLIITIIIGLIVGGSTFLIIESRRPKHLIIINTENLGLTTDSVFVDTLISFTKTESIDVVISKLRAAKLFLQQQLNEEDRKNNILNVTKHG
ncbi:hypothetical protein [Aquimarina macrocephali]|uniref:hypothetical protein n=1 Tax=Aquimarina macrocephali TaxID=666563 RepID=UPI003F67EB26